MIQLFKLSADDQSIYYLGQIFGFVGNLLPVTQAPMILGVMFKTFNTTILSVAVLIVLYVTIVGVMKTAHEGEFLGKNWNSLWVPIRMVLGIAALVPSPSGYCAIQIVVMWIVIQGIGAADVVWNTVLVYSDVAGSPVAPVGIPSVGYSSKFQTLYQGLVCQQTLWSNSSFSAGGQNPYGYYCYSSTDPNNRKGGDFCGRSQDNLLNIMSTDTTVGTGDATGNVTYTMGPNGDCGSVKFCNSEYVCNNAGNDPAKKIQCTACTDQKTILQESVSLLGGIAQTFTSSDTDFRIWANGGAVTPAILNYCRAHQINDESKCCVRPDITDPNVMTDPNLAQRMSCGISPQSLPQGTTSVDQGTVTSLIWPFMIRPTVSGMVNFTNVVSSNYVAAISNSVMNKLGDTETQISNDILSQANTRGWIFAGAYYYYLAQQNNKMSENTVPTFDVSPGGDKSGYRTNYTAAGNLVTAVLAASTTGGNDLASSLPNELKQLSRLSDEFRASGSSVMSSWMSTITGSGAGKQATNVLSNLQSLGRDLLITVQVFFSVMMLVIIPVALIGNLNAYVLGTGADNPVGPSLVTLVIMFAPMVMLLMGALFMAGATLAIYVPLIPYIVYMMGVIAWFILVIEAMVAAPIATLGVLSPSGQHEILGKSEHALMYLFGVFLRPSLMVFGMMAAMLLSIVVVTMINASFSGVVASIYKNMGLVEMMLFVVAYVSIVLAALNKCFALIHIVPDRVLRWIGHAGGEEGAAAAQEGLGRAEKGVSGGAGAFRGVGGAGKGAAKAGHARQVQRQKALDEKKKKPGGPTLS